MKQSLTIGALLCAAALALPSAAAAQQPAGSNTDEKIEQLQQQVEELQKAIAELKAQSTSVLPSWKGAPQLEDKESGWSFKPRGRLQYDFATVSSPDGYDNPGL